MVLKFIYFEKFYSESVNPLNGKPMEAYQGAAAEYKDSLGGLRVARNRSVHSHVHRTDCTFHWCKPVTVDKYSEVVG